MRTQFLLVWNFEDTGFFLFCFCRFLVSLSNSLYIIFSLFRLLVRGRKIEDKPLYGASGLAVRFCPRAQRVEPLWFEAFLSFSVGDRWIRNDEDR